MLIMLGGLKGSGKGELARAIAQTHGIHWYDITQHMMRLYPREQDATVQTHLVRIHNDDERIVLYKKVATDFPMLSKMYKDVIVSATFHRKQSTAYFLEEARKYFSPVIFIWVDADEEGINKRLDDRAIRGGVSGKLL